MRNAFSRKKWQQQIQRLFEVVTSLDMHERSHGGHVTERKRTDERKMQRLMQMTILGWANAQRQATHV
jgi:hypothetical protein